MGRERGQTWDVQESRNDFLFTPRIGVSVKQQFTEEEIYKDRDSQITAIEKTFEDAQKSVIGRTGLTARALLRFLLSDPFCSTRSPSTTASPA